MDKRADVVLGEENTVLLRGKNQLWGGNSKGWDPSHHLTVDYFLLPARPQRVLLLIY